MNGYTCVKACNIGGVAYLKGDAIPFEAVLPSRERALINQGYIARSIADTAAPATPEEIKSLRARVAELEAAASTNPSISTKGDQEPPTIVVPITTKEGVLELSMTPEDIIAAIKTLQLNAENAAKVVGAIEKEEILILIDALDTRKTVKAAIEEKVKAMKGGGEDKGKGDA